MDDIKKSLPQKANYDIEQHFIYGKQKKWKKVIEWIITIFAWLILASYILYLLYGSIAIKFNLYLPEFLFYTREMVLEIQKYFFILCLAALIVTILLVFWKNYNLIRFGKLKRRNFRSPVTNDELAELFKIDSKCIQEMRTKKYILFETNIVPHELGIGDSKNNNKDN